MAPGRVNILLHHGGAFSKQISLTYDGGDVAIFRNIDKHVMSYFHLIDLAKSVGFKDGDTLFYGIPGRSLDNGIDHIKDDNSVSEMMKHGNQTNYLEVYIQHNDHDTGGYPTVGAMEQDDTPAQTMTQLPSKIEFLVFSLQMRRCRIKLLMALHVPFLYWFYNMTPTHQSESDVDSQSNLQCPGSNPSSENKCSSNRKRKYVEEALSLEFSNLSKSLRNLVEAETTNAAAMNVIQSAYAHKLKAQKQTDEKREQLYSVLTKFPEFTREQLVRAARIIGQDATMLNMFFTTPEEFKSEYILQVLESSK